MSRFPTHKHFASWAGRCPGNHESAGKRRSGKTPAANRHLDAVLTEMAHAAVRTKNSYFKAQYHRLAGRRGKKRAIGAVKHSLLVTVYFMLRDNRILVLTTLINSILNNESVTMSADSKNSDKKWSFHLSLMQRKPHPQPNFRRRSRTKFETRKYRSLVRFVTFVVKICASTLVAGSGPSQRRHF